MPPSESTTGAETRPVRLAATKTALQIDWSDGLKKELTWTLLRKSCPCATCKAAREQPPPLFAILKPDDNLPLTVTGMRPVGNYGYQIEFSDGHQTGIFSLDTLRQLSTAAS